MFDCRIVGTTINALYEQERKTCDTKTIRRNAEEVFEERRREVSATPKDIHYYTPDEYFDFIRANEGRYEYRDGEIVLMGGGSKSHAQIMINLTDSLALQLKGCRMIPADIPIKTSHKPFRYADLSVACKPEIEEIKGIGVLTNPVLIVEILSPSSMRADNKQKRKEYTAIPSMQDYLIIDQSICGVVRYSKQGELWARSYYVDLAATIELAAIGCRLPLSDIYAEVELI
jgi:Uma2 family endonuclease